MAKKLKKGERILAKELNFSHFDENTNPTYKIRTIKGHVIEVKNGIVKIDAGINYLTPTNLWFLEEQVVRLKPKHKSVWIHKDSFNNIINEKSKDFTYIAGLSYYKPKNEHDFIELKVAKKGKK